MNSSKPHFLLFCDGNSLASGEGAVSQRGRWRFVLENVENGERSEATDVEPACAPDRCALISVLRGLESLEQPSRVTLVTTSRYVTRGLQYGLTEWRDNDFTWEHFGAVQPIRNADIWRRIDRTLAFHQVQCRWMAHEESSSDDPSNSSTGASAPTEPTAYIQDPAEAANLARRSKTRVSKKPNSRTVVSTANAQRVYVDTAPNITAEPVNIGEIPSNSSVSARALPLAISTTGPNRHQKRKNRTLFLRVRDWHIPGKRALSAIFIPIPRFYRCAIFSPIHRLISVSQSHCRQFWAAILAIDEWLESFVRCLFLLEPANGRMRNSWNKP
jgi:ribonuclease HI